MGHIDNDALRTSIREIFDRECKRLEESGNIVPQVILIGRERTDYVVIDGPIVNDEPAKRALGERLRKRLAEIEGQAVMRVFDTYMSEMLEPEEERKLSAIRRAAGLTLKEAADLGLCKVRECLVAQIETPLLQLHISQFYSRKGKRIEWEERNEWEDVEFKRSRLSGFFETTRAERA